MVQLNFLQLLIQYILIYPTDMLHFLTDLEYFLADLEHFHADMEHFLDDMEHFHADMLHFLTDMVRFHADMLQFYAERRDVRDKNATYSAEEGLGNSYDFGARVYCIIAVIFTKLFNR